MNVNATVFTVAFFLTHIQGGSMGILEQVIDKLSEEFKLTPDRLSADSHLVKDVGCDSLDLAFLWYDFECDFGITIPDDCQFATIGELTGIIQTLKEEKYGSQEISNSITNFQSLENSAQNQLYCSFDVGLRVSVL